jgi:hypothetical protein
MYQGSLQQVSGEAHRVAFVSAVSVAEFLESKSHGLISAPLYAAWNKPSVRSMRKVLPRATDISVGDSTV